ncbi:MAG: PKD domain-containing protein [Acidobacteriota bacterium]
MLTATNLVGSASASQTLSVTGPGVPSANFSFAPSSPLVGQTVTFTDLSTGEPTTWSWDFGDRTDSTSQNSTHAYGAADTYSVTLTATNSHGSNSLTKAVLVATLTTQSATLPVAGHVTGAGGVLFVSDIEIENPNAVPVTADLFFFPVTGGTASQISLTLSPLETRFLPDVVASQFSVTNLFGDLRLDSTGNPRPLLRMTSRTFGQLGSRIFGTAIPGFHTAAPTSASRFVTGLKENDDYRAALGAVNTSDADQTFSAALHGPDGTVLGTSAPVTLPPAGQ